MKKIGYILVSIVLLFATTGLTISKHYSSGSLYSVSVFDQAESCCKIPCACCSEKSTFYKLNVNFTSPDFKVKLDFHSSFEFISIISEQKSIFPTIYTRNYYNDISPPEYLYSADFLQNFRC